MVTKRFDPLLFLERVGSGKTITSYRASQVIFQQGTRASHVFYLQSGKAKETVADDRNKEAIVGMIEPGMFFGTSSLTRSLHFSTVTALVPCIVTAIVTEAMNTALQIPSFAQLFIHYLIKHNSKIESEKVALLFNSREKRLAQKLLILAHFGDGPPKLIGPEITQEMLADMIGTTRPHVNRFLNKFRKLGLIKYNGGITVLPPLLAMLLQDGKETDTNG